MLTILHGSTFCVSDDLGDVGGGAEGLFADDTRMLSRCTLRIDGARPLLLAARRTEYFSAKYVLRNAVTDELPADSVSIFRDRHIASGMTEHLVVRNEGLLPLRFDVELDLAADFADVISVKAHDFAFGDPLTAPPLPPTRRGALSGRTVTIADDEGYTTHIHFSSDVSGTAGGVRWQLALEPHDAWAVTLEIGFGAAPARESPGWHSSLGTELAQAREELNAWKRRAPLLTTPVLDIERSYSRSLADLASLRLHDIQGASELPAAGMPWFMTLFGRDTIITSLQTLLLGPELAAGTLRSLAALQAIDDDPRIDAEPGKILHEVRRGKAAQSWFPVYYGSVDATPLFLVLLSEFWRWTGDDAIVRELETPARRAIAWMDNAGDRDGDGFVEYERRAERGLANQSWKDSGDSQRFRDGRLAGPPIAPAEVQGYVFDARIRASELAQSVWGDPHLSSALLRSAEALGARFDAAFWMEERQAYALALDGEKRQVDSLCSNMGHLLWSGIVPRARQAAVVARLCGEELWSGWGVRTMGAREAAYNPLSYHNGSVWPHDTAIAAWGLARAGYWDDAQHLARCLIDAAGYFDHSLPEVFAGFPRHETAFPVPYPTAARPQAWAAGAPVLALRLLLGLEPDPASGQLTARAPSIPWLERTRLEGVRAFGTSWVVRVSDSEIQVDAG